MTRSTGSSISRRIDSGLEFLFSPPDTRSIMKNRRVPFAAGLRYFFRIPYQSWSAYSTDVGKIGHRFGAIVRIGSVSTRLDRCEINPKVGRKGANFRLERSVRTICRAVLKIDILPASEIGADQSPPRRVSRPQKSGVTARSRGS